VFRKLVSGEGDVARKRHHCAWPTSTINKERTTMPTSISIPPRATWGNMQKGKALPRQRQILPIWADLKGTSCLINTRCYSNRPCLHEASRAEPFHLHLSFYGFAFSALECRWYRTDSTPTWKVIILKTIPDEMKFYYKSHYIKNNFLPRWS